MLGDITWNTPRSIQSEEVSSGVLVAVLVQETSWVPLVSSTWHHRGLSRTQKTAFPETVGAPADQAWDVRGEDQDEGTFLLWAGSGQQLVSVIQESGPGDGRLVEAVWEWVGKEFPDIEHFRREWVFIKNITKFMKLLLWFTEIYCIWKTFCKHSNIFLKIYVI